MPKSVADDLIAKSNGDVSEIEKYLGLDPGDLGASPVRIDIDEPKGLRMPSGNEDGTNPTKWIPGGFTDKEVPEAVINPVSPGDYTVSNITGIGGK